MNFDLCVVSFLLEGSILLSFDSLFSLFIFMIEITPQFHSLLMNAAVNMGPCFHLYTLTILFCPIFSLNQLNWWHFSKKAIFRMEHKVSFISPLTNFLFSFVIFKPPSNLLPSTLNFKSCNQFHMVAINQLTFPVRPHLPCAHVHTRHGDRTQSERKHTSRSSRLHIDSVCEERAGKEGN